MTNFWFDVDALRRAYMQARTDLAFIEGFASTAKIMTDGEISDRFAMIQERAKKSLDAIAPPQQAAAEYRNMSMIMCERCDYLIDSDDDPDCFCEAPDYMPAEFRKAVGTEVVCEPCRKRQWDRENAQ